MCQLSKRMEGQARRKHDPWFDSSRSVLNALYVSDHEADISLLLHDNLQQFSLALTSAKRDLIELLDDKQSVQPEQIPILEHIMKDV